MKMKSREVAVRGNREHREQLSAAGTLNAYASENGSIKIEVRQ